MFYTISGLFLNRSTIVQSPITIVRPPMCIVYISIYPVTQRVTLSSISYLHILVYIFFSLSYCIWFSLIVQNLKLLQYISISANVYHSSLPRVRTTNNNSMGFFLWFLKLLLKVFVMLETFEQPKYFLKYIKYDVKYKFSQFFERFSV